LPENICYRKELFNDLCKALNTAYRNNSSVYDAMKEIRNIKRRVGRKITGKCIGTTLLTKGLEFDTVVLLNAHKFSDVKNLYVALTRATKNLVVFTENEILNPSVKHESN
jgi:DNA helicase-2/ATP-dependent DNA helicase PcrA